MITVLNEIFSIPFKSLKKNQTILNEGHSELEQILYKLYHLFKQDNMWRKELLIFSDFYQLIATMLCS